MGAFLGRMAIYIVTMGAAILLQRSGWLSPDVLAPIAWGLGGIGAIIIYETGLWKAGK